MLELCARSLRRWWIRIIFLEGIVMVGEGVTRSSYGYPIFRHGLCEDAVRKMFLAESVCHYDLCLQ